jgi:hypothetical protein
MYYLSDQRKDYLSFICVFQKIIDPLEEKTHSRNNLCII